ncbi:MAG: alpha/beta hydrolase fold domain-containing protein [Clostridia bacterium]|nr:alpha/beta hydrolase fold domain-containing protein [Clostridia bacterium]
MARIAEIYLKMAYKARTDDEIEKELQNTDRSSPERYTKPRSLRLSSDCTESSVNGCPVYSLRNGAGQRRTIIYLHGGAYAGEITTFHWKAADRLAKMCDAEVVVPIYKLVPYATYREAYDLIKEVYVQSRNQHPDRQIILMGDSAGGGLALALCEYFARKGIAQPDRTILFSPWVDVNLENPKIREYEKRDVFLSTSLRVYGRWWAGDTGTDDYRISPLFGDVEGLDHITIFVGTNEILYPDIIQMYEKISASGHDHELIVGKEMSHVYPLFPIPEGKRALSYCCSIINGSVPERRNT